MSSVLITGGTGFVGINAAKAFAEKGCSVVLTSRKRIDHTAEALAAENSLIRVAYLDLANSADVFGLFSRHRFDGLVMLAHAHQYARTRAANHAIYPMNINCLEGASSTGVKRIVLASSRAIYGGLNPPFNEDVRFPATVSYAGTRVEKLGLPHVPEFETTVKRAIELMTFDYAIPMPAPTSDLSGVPEQAALEVVALRFPIQWGPGYSAMGNPFGLAAHATAGRIQNLSEKTGYFGMSTTDLWNLLSGTPSAYVKDSASAIVTTMLAEKLPNRIYNVSSCFNDIARDQLEALYRIAPSARESVGIDPGQLEGNERPDTGFNANRLINDFGWKPVFSDIGEAFEEYIGWLKHHAY